MATRGAHHVRSNSQSNNQRAQLANAYQELAKELGSDKLKVVGGYTLGRVIGEGTYGSVHIATHRLTGTRVAIKKIPKSLTSQLTREIHHHRLLHHQHILHLHEVLATETHIWLVTELCSGGELFDYLVERGRLLEGEGRRVFGELVVAVGIMHQKGTVHRDLKLENVLLDGECRVKLGDLGFAREWTRGSRLLETYCGTTGYASPEMLQGKKYSGEETDIWSLGIILYALLCGGLPFDDDDEELMKKLIIKGEYEEPEWLSDEAKDLIRNLLHQDPSSRLSIKAILSHAWFNKRIIDPPLHTIPGAEGSGTPASASARSPEKESSFLFDETLRTKSPMPDVVSKWNQSFPTPIAASDEGEKVTKKTSSSKSVTLVMPRPDSDGTTSSHASFDFQDSEKGKTSSGLTTPTTAEGGDVNPPLLTPKVEQATDPDKLSLMQSNESQSTIRKAGEDTLSRRSSGSGTAVTSRGRLTVLEGQREEDESEAETSSRPVSYVDGNLDFSNMHLPVALHSRTPSRTKRRSVSSTLSDRRPTLHSTSSFQANETPVIDYLGQLCFKPPPLFSTPSERQLLNSLAAIGFDTGQLVHSVMSDACDASGATWWLLRAKQMERHDDESMTITSAPSEVPRTASTIRETPREEAASSDVFLEGMPASNSNKTVPSDGGKTPRAAAVELGSPVIGGGVIELRRPSISPIVHTGHLPTVPESPKRPQAVPPLQPAQGDDISVFSPSPRADKDNLPPIPQSPGVANGVQKLPTPQGLPGSPSSSPNKRGDSSKNRSASFNMLQRATSVFGSAGLSKKKSIEKLTGEELVDPAAERKEKANKLTKAPPLPAKDTSGSRSPTRAPATDDSHASGSGAQHDISTSSSYGTVYSLASASSSALSAEDSPSKGKQAKTNKKDGLLTTFRSWFNEDRRKRKRVVPGSPMSASGKVGGHQMNRVPSVRSLYSHAPQRITVVSRINPHDMRPALHSRRSSSVNSRRSSIVSIHAQGIDLSGTSPPCVSRKHSGSRRSVGSRTPTSERDYGSRPSSVHGIPPGPSVSGSGTSLSMHGKSASIGSTGSTQAVNIQSPAHRQPFRSSTGRSSGREFSGSAAGPQHRTNSTNSSRRSSSSRRSIAGDDQDFSPAMDLDPNSDLDLSHDDSSIRSKSRRRKSADDRHHASVILARRTKSPLSSNMSFADAQRPYRHSRPTQPMRDVFAKNRDGKGGVGDDDWISEEDEESGYAGGLGQLGSKLSAAWGGGHNTVDESGELNAGGSPTVRPTSSLVGTPSLRKLRDKGKKGPSSTVGEGDSGGSSFGSITNAGSDTARDAARPVGRGLNSTRPTRIVEEDEEEE